MPSPLRTGAGVTLNRPPALGAVALALTAETLLRAGLGLIHPILAVLCPPIVAVPVLGSAFPATRTAARGEDADWRSAGSTLRDRAVSLLGVAVAGHAASLAVGTALFLLVDTPVRYALYAFGGGESTPPTLVSAIPLVGVAAGTILAWSLATPAVVRALDADAPGETRTRRLGAARKRSTAARVASIPRTIGAAAATAIANPRRAALAVGLQLLAVAAASGVVFTGLVYASRARSLAAFLAVGGGLGLLTAIVAFGFVYPVHAALANERSQKDGDAPRASRNAPGSKRSPSTTRVALALLTVTGLVLGAGAVRVTETRPIDAAPEPLPDDPSAAYAVALNNTARSSYAYEAQFGPANETEFESSSETATYEAAVDRPARRHRGRLNDGPVGYADAGALTPGRGTNELFALGARRVRGQSVEAVPGYWHFVEYGGPVETGFGLPESDARGWSVVDRGTGTRTVELTECAAVIEALRDVDAEDATCERARVRMVLDDERGVVTGGEAVLNASIDGHRLSYRGRYDVTVDVAVERPSWLGPRTSGEWVWKLFAY